MLLQQRCHRVAALLLRRRQCPHRCAGTHTHLGDANDHVVDMRARSADRRALLARGEPPLNSDRLAIRRDREVDRQVRQVLVKRAARALDNDFPCLDRHGNAVRHLHGLGLEDRFLQQERRQRGGTSAAEAAEGACQGPERRERASTAGSPLACACRRKAGRSELDGQEQAGGSAIAGGHSPSCPCEVHAREPRGSRASRTRKGRRGRRGGERERPR